MSAPDRCRCWRNAWAQQLSAQQASRRRQVEIPCRCALVGRLAASCAGVQKTCCCRATSTDMTLFTSHGVPMFAWPLSMLACELDKHCASHGINLPQEVA